MTLEELRSPWTTSISWRYFSPDPTSRRILPISSSPSGFVYGFDAANRAKVPPLHHSWMIQISCSGAPASIISRTEKVWACTKFGWRSFRQISASLMGSTLDFFPCFQVITFTATSFPCHLPRKTWPKDPCPTLLKVSRPSIHEPAAGDWAIEVFPFGSFGGRTRRSRSWQLRTFLWGNSIPSSPPRCLPQAHQIHQPQPHHLETWIKASEWLPVALGQTKAKQNDTLPVFGSSVYTSNCVRPCASLFKCMCVCVCPVP